jgi:hypothetical protein
VPLLFVLLSLLVCALVNAGNFGTIDTSRRLQVARWIRLGEPSVSAADTGFGLTGRYGVRYAWFGIGQSLVLLPFDALVGAGVSPHLGRFGLNAEKQRQVAELLIAFLMQSFVTACLLVLAHKVLLSFGFTAFVSTAGTLALLFGTSCLQYVQCAQENNLLLLLALCALWGVRRWHSESAARWALLAGAACGFAILVRLTSLLETGVLALFAVAAGGNRRHFLAGFLPPVAAALLFDRWYHWRHFGELFSTYIGIFGRQYRPAGAPVTFPFSYPFAKGFLGTLFSPDKSIVLFDPLLVILLVMVSLKWSGISRHLRLLIHCLALLLVLYAAVYATYYDFGGDAAWGHRFVTLPVHLLCLFAIPLLLTYTGSLSSSARRIAWTIVAVSVIIQAASTMISPNAEIIQKQMGYGKAVIWNRAVNLVQLASGNEDSHRFTGIPIEWRSPNYLPFQLRFRFPRLARWAIAGWVVLLVCLPFLVGAALWNARQQDAANMSG